MFAPSNLVGSRFGRLIAVEYVKPARWRCYCDCGNAIIALTSNLTSGNTSSCGCTRVKHGASKDPVYRAWIAMRRRCEVTSDPAFANYGGRGITVSLEWSDFSRFLADMGARPKGHQLDRIDNNGPYSRENCRWAPQKTNLNNKRSNRVIEHDGERLTIAQWSDRLGINYRTLNNRINRGWSINDALTVRPKKE